MVMLLVERGANVNAEATDSALHGLTPTLIAEDQGYDDLAAYLRSKGGTVNQVFVAKRAARRAFTNVVGPFLYSH
jgi:ankyrin repeat protein